GPVIVVSPSPIRWVSVMRPPLRRFVPIGSLPYSVTVEAAPRTPASAALLVVTNGGVLRPRVNQPSHSRRNMFIAQSQLQQSLRQVFWQPQLLQPLQPPPPLSKKLVCITPLPTAERSATYRAFC